MEDLFGVLGTDIKELQQMEEKVHLRTFKRKSKKFSQIDIKNEMACK